MNNVFLSYTGCRGRVHGVAMLLPMGDYTDNIKRCYHVYVYVITYRNKYVYV